MSLSASAVTVSTTATALSSSGTSVRRQSFLLHNAGSVTVYLGGADVTSTTGLPLPAGEKLGLDLANAQEELFGVVVAGTCDVRVLATGL